jgi:hypothetical protein
MAALFCLLLSSTIILLTIMVIYCYCKELTVPIPKADSNVLLPTTITMPSITNALPCVTETAAVPLLGKYQPPPMPIINKESEHDMLRASFEVPACQQVKSPSVILVMWQCLHDHEW